MKLGPAYRFPGEDPGRYYTIELEQHARFFLEPSRWKWILWDGPSRRAEAEARWGNNSVPIILGDDFGYVSTRRGGIRAAKKAALAIEEHRTGKGSLLKHTLRLTFEQEDA